MGRQKGKKPVKGRNWTAVHAKLRSGAGPHRSKRDYDRSRCPDCDNKLDANGLCAECKEEENHE